jgi:Holliday junction resolvase
MRRKKNNPAGNKRRGFSFEREIVRMVKDAGFSAERAYASNGKSLGEAETVDCILNELRVQCKRHKEIAAKYRIPEGADMVVFREDRGETMVILPLVELMKLW